MVQRNKGYKSAEIVYGGGTVTKHTEVNWMKSEGGTKMKYKVSERKIYTTTDYDMFVFTEWNRDVSNARVVKMVESIKRVGWLPQPVLVNENFEVCDGQSRVKALEALGMPVEFCIQKGIGRVECQMMNLFQKNWATKDFIDSYASDGNKNYIWLREMFVRYKILTPSVVQSIAVGKNYRLCAGNITAIIQEGKLDLSDSEKIKAEKALFYLSRFAETAEYLGGRKDTFYSALFFLYQLEDIDKERLVTVINNARYDGLVASSIIEGWLNQFELLYNKKLLKSNRVDFVHEYKIAQ